uniref:Uncharacterized protein n=1 Tax=Arundo donax TaxID=35708 RepID=A0A0A9G8K7_ARUDO
MMHKNEHHMCSTYNIRYPQGRETGQYSLHPEVKLSL